MPKSMQLGVIVESSHRFTRRIWWSAIGLALLAVVMSWQGQCAWPTAPSSAMVVGIMVAVVLMPHAVTLAALSSHRLEQLVQAPIDLERLPDERLSTLRVLRSPFVVQRRNLITRGDVESLSESERPLARVIETVTNWSIARLLIALFGGGYVVFFLDPANAGISREILGPAWIVLLATCVPRIAPWLDRFVVEGGE